jgi:hypothetical protein
VAVVQCQEEHGLGLVAAHVAQGREESTMTETATVLVAAGESHLLRHLSMRYRVPGVAPTAQAINERGCRFGATFLRRRARGLCQ